MLIKNYFLCINVCLPQDIMYVYLPQDIKILGWSPVGVSLTSSGEGASLPLVGHPSSDGVTIKMPYGVDVLHRPASHPIFFYWVG